MNDKTKVFLYEDAKIKYPQKAPYHPSTNYPEFGKFPHEISDDVNLTYDAVRNTLIGLGLDKENYGTEHWNPLRDYISKNGKVLIKPNLVHQPTYYVAHQDIVLTHGSIIRAVLDYVVIALGENGTITIGDSPVFPADFEKMIKSLGLPEMVKYYSENFNFCIDIVDFRIVKGIYSDTGYFKGKIESDSTTHTELKLKDSAHKEFESQFELTDRKNPVKTYTLHNSILEADCIINLPKLKTHKIAGITCCIKAMIGANSQKSQILPHYKKGGASEGGDEYKEETLLMRIKRVSLSNLKKGPKIIFDIAQVLFSYYRNITLKTGLGKDLYGSMLEHGAWSGNDTLWRSMLDLNRCVIYGKQNGEISSKIQRKMFCLVDGIIAGEGQGPMNPVEKNIGVLIAGSNPLAVDLVSIRLMGFDWMKLNTYIKILNNGPFFDDLKDFENKLIFKKKLKTIQEGEDFEDIFKNKNPFFSFQPPVGWDDIKITKNK